MSVHQQLHGQILTPDGWLNGTIKFIDTITALSADSADSADSSGAESAGPYILPGFIDLHVHGAGGKDTMEAGDAVSLIARQHARHGTTSMLATTMTAPLADIEAALQAIRPLLLERPAGTARVLGVHLEGPYINPGKLGAQPDFAGVGSLEQVLRFDAIAAIKLVTVAPEIPGHLELVRQLCAIGMVVQIGHTLGTYEDGVAALASGARGFTHLYNAMSRLDQRAPGMVGAALAHAQYSEIIPDLLHVHPGAIRAALRAIPQLYCVTDSTAATGMPDGPYMLGRQIVHKCLGGVRLADGTLAGSTLTMDQALRNLVAIGLDLADASRRVSTNAADYLGLSQRGRLRVGAFADMVVLDSQLKLIAVYVEGEKIELANT
ncbi:MULTISPECIES: N-acetylglucosamine-6-phosphate deacetylase [unclassified Undibacterium]|uniref:N-acetylglucosamine-6-phosphate deacetylase n=1 Tax=unclassified Undibacterium TaxID=2630295 RepID=UPI002AC8D7E5|nr:MULTISPECIES: N-acetylglucosamine-6-phosphate deacetylase [unclassified Undibacterium]MEB0139777.1 N-acetylglucosamine-6-phosphate deacetylase [Undibacterium sp. CCC2.1]MEB0170515.1 N-acetylglucosamine-6-phosphate deacetylase [Undibacterium sp. CCC1.1]MEB0174456.1 N-acetylglucosamine-6-phosphate deacetylase [Undibacterium sp. CCC3.4]MEB0213747.1 N-acetylglucosamine-6-phosphate deacetylase [Undibacterium sp. 5I2]WPX43911.1 N-acetylglucosamine-6-phosphate deacetylase [Undibacterium sp. CCC3.4